MSEAITSEAQTTESSTSGNMGMIKGVPGRRVENIGLLDLRGARPEDLQQVEWIKNVGAILIDPPLKGALTHIHLENVGTVVEVAPDCQVLVEPWQEFSRATLEAMTPGQKLFLVGMVLFRPDVPSELVAEKFAELHVVGVLMAPAGVQGALLGKLHITGVPVTLPSDKDIPIIHNIGQNLIGNGYLKYLADNAMYINIGQTVLESDVSEELLASKFASYINVGQTVAPRPLLDLLKARCATNLGHFAEPSSESEGDAGQ
jgi:hypothetical protein